MALLDRPPPADAPSAMPLIPKEVPPPIGFPPVRPLILHISPPPGLSNPEEYYYNPSPDVIQGSFTAAHAFFVSNSHEVTMINCPDFDAFLVASPGAIVVGLPSSWCWCSCKGFNFSSIKLSLDSCLGLVVLRSGGAPQLLLPDCFSIVTQSSPQDQLLPCCLQQSFHPTALWLSKSRVAAIMFPLRCITEVCPLAPIWLASTLLSLLAHRYIMGGMASSPTIRSHRMSVLPRHCMLTTIMGSSSMQLPLPPKISTITIPTMAILCIMGGTHPLKRLPQWGASCYSSGCSFICVRRWEDLSPGSWGVSPCGCIGYPEPWLCKLIDSPFFAAEQSSFLFWLRHHTILFQPWSRPTSSCLAPSPGLQIHSTFFPVWSCCCPFLYNKGPQARSHQGC